MQQDNNNIENKLRKLENQQLPDLSAMDAHWKGMQTILSSGVIVPAKKTFFNSSFKKLLLAASIAAAVVAIYFVNQHYKAVNTTSELAGNTIITESAGQLSVTVTDTPVKKIILKLTGHQVTPVFKVKILPAAPAVKIDSLFFIQKIDTIEQIEALPNNGIVSLSSFYNAIQKPAQEFTISAAKGGEIVCKEGTKISIPAAVFYDAEGKPAAGEIKIIVVEFYKYSEMIAANLITSSDGNQLVTGGMIKITATQNNTELRLHNNKAINLSMPTNNYDPEMELFYGEKNNRDNKYVVNKEQDINSYKKKVNWKVAGLQNRYPLFDGKTKVMVFDDIPYKIHNTFRVIGKFNIPLESPYTDEQAQAILEEKYGGLYDKIKVRKVKRQVLRQGIFGRRFSITPRLFTGDSVRLKVDEALRAGHIQKSDSLWYVQKTISDSLNFVNQVYADFRAINNIGFESRTTKSATLLIAGRDSAIRADYKKYADSAYKSNAERGLTEVRYNFTVKNMGWINCDRFYSYSDKTDFVLNLPADVQADKFVTQIVFTSIRSVMPGQFDQNKIGFLNIPVNMPVYLVGLGERNGKVVSFMQSFKTSSSSVSVATLEETTPEAFKEKLKQLDF